MSGIFIVFLLLVFVNIMNKINDLTQNMEENKDPNGWTDKENKQMTHKRKRKVCNDHRRKNVLSVKESENSTMKLFFISRVLVVLEYFISRVFYHHTFLMIERI